MLVALHGTVSFVPLKENLAIQGATLDGLLPLLADATAAHADFFNMRGLFFKHSHAGHEEIVGALFVV